MPLTTFDEFDKYFSFAVKVCEVLGTGSILCLIYKYDIVRKIWRVAQGDATEAQRLEAVDVMERGGATAEQLTEETAKKLEEHRHPEVVEVVDRKKGCCCKDIEDIHLAEK
jgi:hypothetical protein